MYNISNEKRKEIMEFYYKYQDFFSNEAHYLFSEFAIGNDNFCDILLELYTYFQVLENEVNPYYDFYRYLCDKHKNIEKRKILEVASGYIPVVSYLITINQNMENKIVSMDPNNIPIKIKGIRKMRKNFSLRTNIDSFDLLIAHCPCDAFELLLTKAIKEKKEFTIQTCQCSSGGGYFYSRYDWLDYIKSCYDKALALEDDGFIVEKEYLELSYMMDAPIITARKRILTNPKEFHQ